MVLADVLLRVDGKDRYFQCHMLLYGLPERSQGSIHFNEGWCRGAIHCARLGRQCIPQGAIHCAPTPHCASLKCIGCKGRPYYSFHSTVLDTLLATIDCMSA